MRSLPLLILLSGCATASNFGTKAAGAACDSYKTCERADYDNRWSNKGECVDDLDDLFGGDCYLENCDTFVANEANACLSGVRAAECNDDTPASCSDVWTDCDGFALGACLLAEGVQLF